MTHKAGQIIERGRLDKFTPSNICEFRRVGEVYATDLPTMHS